MKFRLKDLSTAYRVLMGIEEEVPEELLQVLSSMIDEKKRRSIERKESGRIDLQIIRPNGRIIHESTINKTFLHAISCLSFQKIVSLDIARKRGKRYFIALDPNRKRLPGYTMIREGCFVLTAISTEERISILQRINEKLSLQWDIIKLQLR